MARPGKAFQPDLEIEDVEHAAFPRLALFVLHPGVADVPRRAPQVADVGRPFPRLGGAPLAHRKNDIATGVAQRHGHDRIVGLGIVGAGLAPVVFQVVDAPARIGLGVLVFMAARARMVAAGFQAGVGIDAELQPLGMDVVGQGLDARRKALGVGDDEAVFIAALLPAVVDDDVLIAGGLHAGRHHGVGGAANLGFVDIAVEVVPGIPAHRRGLSHGRLGLLKGHRSRAVGPDRRRQHQAKGDQGPGDSQHSVLTVAHGVLPSPSSCGVSRQ